MRHRAQASTPELARQVRADVLAEARAWIEKEWCAAVDLAGTEWKS